MPEKILALLEKQKLTQGQIAEKLGVSVEELHACMEYLQQMNFIKATWINPTGGGCSGSCGRDCSKCHSYSGTISSSAYTIWEIQ